MKPGDIYTNKKNGTHYIVIGIAIDATNIRDENRVVVYKSCESAMLFVRDEIEFYEKFEPSKKFEPECIE